MALCADESVILGREKKNISAEVCPFKSQNKGFTKFQILMPNRNIQSDFRKKYLKFPKEEIPLSVIKKQTLRSAIFPVSVEFRQQKTERMSP